MGDRVFVNGRAIVHKGSAGRSTAFPDVCFCPPAPPAGPIPTPLSNTVVAADLVGGASSVLVEGNPTGHRDSEFARSTGNEVARPTGGGVVTGGVQGKARFRSHSMNVFIEGKPAVRHLDLLTHNHVGQPGNTPPTVWTSVMAPALARPTRAPRSRSRSSTAGRGWIELRFFAEDGEPAGEVACRLQLADGTITEARLGTGGRLRLDGIAPGRCTMILPEIDAAAKALGEVEPGSSGRRPSYEPGRALALETGKAHALTVPLTRTLWIDLPVRTRDVRSRDDRFVLRSADGRYEVARTIADDRRRTDEGLTLAFPGLTPGQRYTLMHDEGEGGGVHTIFADAPFEALFADDGPEEEEIEAAAPAAPTADAEVWRERRRVRQAREDEDAEKHES